MEPLAPDAAYTLPYHSADLSPLSCAQDAGAGADKDVTTEDKDEEEDEDFNFNAPSFYDLTNPALERHYVNNADGYFSSPTPSGATSTAESHEKERTGSSQTTEVAIRPCESYLGETYHTLEVDTDAHMETMAEKMLDTTMVENELDDTLTDVDHVLNRSHLLDDRQESFEDVFRHYASSSQSSITSSYLLQEVDTSTHSSSATHGQFSPYSSSSSAAATAATLRETRTRSASNGLQTLPSATSTLSTDELPSKLMQPTQSYLRRLQADQKLREQSSFDDVLVEEKPHRATRPRSPKMHVKTRLVNPNDQSRLSSTSRELLKIQEERLHLQMEKLKIREFHEKTKVQRPPANVHLRSTKQLTVPLTPRFAVENRVRRCRSGSDSNESGQAKPSPPIAAEKLLSRDFALSLPLQSRENRSATMAPHAPHLRTAARAVLRPPPAPISREKAKSVPIYSRFKLGGVTQPMTPQLETSRRAATYRRPVEVIDHDAEELAKKFQARPLNRHILAPKAYSHYSLAKPDSKDQLKQSTGPKLQTSARSATRMAASERAASVAVEMECHRKERERRLAARPARVDNAAQVSASTCSPPCNC
uniref:TPX2 central domain-containing protein n=1 Tax=Peronospora matthiolae TaxID=2874970 RepID=A0AAV1UUI8_9STRA